MPNTMTYRTPKLICLAVMITSVCAGVWATITTPTAVTHAAVSASTALLAPAPTADMRPVAWITTGGAPRTDKNPTGLRRQLVDPDEGYAWLLDQFLTQPFERFIIHLPAQVNQGDKQGNAQYWPIEPSRLEKWLLAIRDAQRQRPEITIGAYGSLLLQYTHSIDQPAPHLARFSSTRDKWTVWQQAIAPWIRAGCYEYWWDAASGSEVRADAVKFSQWLAYLHGVRAGMEAFATDEGNQGARVLDTATMNRLPSLALLAFVRAFDPRHEWDVSDLRYEAIVIVQPTRNWTKPKVSELTSLLERGFVLGADTGYSGEYVELVKKAYEAVPDGE